MITADGLKDVNKRVKSVEIHGKNYVCVPARVEAFRELCPMGTITTEILNMDAGSVLMKTTIKDEDGKILATGMAQEREDSSYINKTSYIENCETSAVGRALGLIGIGSDQQMASAEEMVNALANQEKMKEGRKTQPGQKKSVPAEAKISSKDLKWLEEITVNHKIPEFEICRTYGKKVFQDLTADDVKEFKKTGKAFLDKWDEDHK